MAGLSNPEQSVKQWLVTDADSTDGRAVWIEAADEQGAATLGIDALYAEQYDHEPPHSVFVLPGDERVRYRALYSGERVPDEFQCCGGMPAMNGPGTQDEHTAPCARGDR